MLGCGLLCLAGFIALPLEIGWRNQEIWSSLPGDLEKSIQLSEFFAHGFGVLVIVVGLLILFPQIRRKLPRVIGCIVAAGLAANLLKLIAGRRRPISLNEETVEKISDSWAGWFVAFQGQFDYMYQAFPSGHTATAVGLAIGLSWLLPRGAYFFFSLAALAGLQRIVSQAHWPSDVAFGAAIGLLCASCLVCSQRLDGLFAKWETSEPDRF